MIAAVRAMWFVVGPPIFITSMAGCEGQMQRSSGAGDVHDGMLLSI